MAYNAVSTFTVQNEIDKVRTFSLLEPIFNVAGFSTEPALTICTDVMTAICAVNFPHKWNEVILPVFYTNSLQQDYALVNPDGSSVLNVEWLERGVAFDINNTSVPKPPSQVECGRSQPQRTGSFSNSGSGFIANTQPNYMMYYGRWGQGNIGSATLGNNPTVGSSYTNPLSCFIVGATWVAGQITFFLNYLPTTVTVGSSLVVTGVLPVAYNNTFAVVSISGNSVTVTSVANPGKYLAGGVVGTAISQPSNPITQIIDSNGNFLLLTTYGTEGTTAPTASVNATPGTTCAGTGATTIWTVLDPNGIGIRILPVPSQTGVVWQINLVAQKTPVIFTSLQQTLAPLPDKYEPFFRAGFIAQCYRYSPEAKIRAKFEAEWKLWQQKLQELRGVQDRELEEYGFTLDRSIMGRGTSTTKYEGAGWPFNYPRL